MEADAVVSNPPYVVEGEVLMPEVRATSLRSRCSPGTGSTCCGGCGSRRSWRVEHGSGQADAVSRDRSRRAGYSVERIRDLAGIERVVVGRR